MYINMYVHIVVFCSHSGVEHGRILYVVQQIFACENISFLRSCSHLLSAWMVSNHLLRSYFCSRSIHVVHVIVCTSTHCQDQGIETGAHRHHLGESQGEEAGVVGVREDRSNTAPHSGVYRTLLNQRYAHTQYRVFILCTCTHVDRLWLVAFFFQSTTSGSFLKYYKTFYMTLCFNLYSCYYNHNFVFTCTHVHVCTCVHVHVCMYSIYTYMYNMFVKPAVFSSGSRLLWHHWGADGPGHCHEEDRRAPIQHAQAVAERHRPHLQECPGVSTSEHTCTCTYTVHVRIVFQVIVFHTPIYDFI